ncbi:MAG: hypothetical protein AAF441_01920 [Pseudomonadota bacterium]
MRKMKGLLTLILMFSIFKSNSQDIFFGDYKKPDLLQKLEEYQRADGQTWEWLGFYIEYDHHYSATPLDVIPFAGTGGDGIHFGFLTDFGSTTDLDKAPVVCVSPTNDPPIKLVAKNLIDFLCLVAAISHAEFLDEDYETDEEVKTRLQEWDEVSEKDWQGNPLPKDEIEQMKQITAETKQGRNQLTKVLKEQFHIDPMPNVSEYIKDLRDTRQTDITIKTSDDIGIKFQTDKLTVQGFDYNIKNNNQVKDYLDKASEPERLKFYRDATYHYILNKNYDYDIKKTITASLKKDGYEREAKILEKKY